MPQKPFEPCPMGSGQLLKVSEQGGNRTAGHVINVTWDVRGGQEAREGVRMGLGSLVCPQSCPDPGGGAWRGRSCAAEPAASHNSKSAEFLRPGRPRVAGGVQAGSLPTG